MPASDSYAIMRHLFTIGFVDSEERMLEGTERFCLLILVCSKGSTHECMGLHSCLLP